MKHAIVLLFVVLGVAACGTDRHSIDFSKDRNSIPIDAKFVVGDVTDNSGFVFSQDEESLDIPVSMEAALTEQLTEEGLLATGDDAGYAINPTINEYEPGNAFARWLLPGAGSTILKVSSDIQTPDKAPVATIETTNTIYAGGAYTIGAWRSIFESGAEEIVEQLKKSMGLLEASDGPQPVS